MKTVKLAAISLASLFVSSTALAQGKVDNIGNAGQFVFGVDRVTGLAFNHLTNRQTALTPQPGGTLGITTVKNRDTYTQVSFMGSSQAPILNTGYPVPVLVPRLAFDYLPIDWLTVGGSFMVLHDGGNTKRVNTTPRPGPGPVGTKDEVSSTLVLLEPRGGFAYPFNSIVGIWPRIGFQWYHVNAEDTRLARVPGDNMTNIKIRGDLFQASLEFMVVLSPFSHVAILLGPFADIGLGGSGRIRETDTAGNGAVTIPPSIEQHPLMNSYGLTSSLVAYFP